MKNLAIIILMFLPGLAKSQVWQDSLFVNEQQANVYKLSLLRHGLVDTIGAYGRVGLRYDHSSGDFRRAQEAFSKKAATFYAEGFSKLNNISLSGNFTFNKIFEDSISHSLRSDLDLLSPTYFYASKANTFERQNYIANATVSYDIIKHKLAPFLHVNYQTHWTTGSVDPRPDIRKFMLKVSPGITYKANSGMQVGLMAILGHSDERTSIAYKNSSYQDGLNFPERRYWLNVGYGYFAEPLSLQLNSRATHRGAELTLRRDIGQWDMLSFLRFERTNSKYTHVPNSSRNYAVRAKFILSEYTTELLFSRKASTHDQQLRLSAELRNGYDGNIEFSSSLSKVNYRVNQNNLRAAYSIILNKQKNYKHELGLSLDYREELRSEAASSVALSSGQITFSPEYRSYLGFSNRDLVVASIAPFYIIPNQTRITSSPNSINNFTRDVVYPDYYYLASDVAGLNLGLSWVSKNLISKNLLELGFNGTYMDKQSISDNHLGARFLPHDQRFHITLGVKMFF